jgi:arylsulfatase A-like enzyme
MTVGSRTSVLLVTVDCLRADHAGFMGCGRPTTPFLDSLARESFVFPAAITGGAPTYFSFPTILVSRFPLTLGRDQLGLAPGEASLASVLKDAGYATAAFNAGNPYLSKRFGYDQGFDQFQDSLGAEFGPLPDGAKGTPGNGGWATAFNRRLARLSHRFGPVGAVYDELYFQYCQRWGTPNVRSLDDQRRFPAADVVVGEALSWLAGLGDTRFFLWLHFMDPHSPYYPTQAALESMGEGRMRPFRARYLNSYWNRSDLGPRRLSRHCDEIIRLYDAGVRWVDTQMLRLVSALRESKQWDDCILAFTADHGEEFLDHGGRYHQPGWLNEELIHVPLLLRVPRTTPKALSKAPFSHLHLAPTLLDAAGVAVPASFHGHSHWQQLRDGGDWEALAISESVAGCTNPFLPDNRLGPRALAVREERYKLMLHFGAAQERLYDLEVDPREQSPLPAGAEKVVRRRLLEAARNHLRRSISERDVQARLRLRLRDLQLEWAAPVQGKQPVASYACGGRRTQA